MRTLRIPTNRNEITPELLGDLVANLRKLCNLSGTGCTINELPNGISIDVPRPKPPGLGRLQEDLYGCGSAKATWQGASTQASGSGGGSESSGGSGDPQ